MMNIFYNNMFYEASNLKILEEKAPFFKPSIAFIREWLANKEKFQFQSSGSTGQPKLLEITRSQILASVDMTKRHLNLQKGEKALVCLSSEYVATKMMVARCMALDLDMVLVEPCANPMDHIDPTTQIDFASFVPMQVQKIMDSGQSSNFGKIRNVLIGGAPLHNSLIINLKKFNNNIYHTYGMTETVSHIALRKLDKNGHTNQFTCLNGVNIRTDENNCLVVSGPMTGHKEIFTKDLVKLISQHEFIWEGRKDNLVNSGGIKIIPELVEEQLVSIFKKVKLSNDFFITGIEDPILGQKLILLVEGEQAPQKTMVSLDDNMKKFLPKYHIPKEVFFLKQFIKTASGKIRRKETLKTLN